MSLAMVPSISVSSLISFSSRFPILKTDPKYLVYSGLRSSQSCVADVGEELVELDFFEAFETGF